MKNNNIQAKLFPNNISNITTYVSHISKQYNILLKTIPAICMTGIYFIKNINNFFNILFVIITTKFISFSSFKP